MNAACIHPIAGTITAIFRSLAYFLRAPTETNSKRKRKLFPALTTNFFYTVRQQSVCRRITFPLLRIHVKINFLNLTLKYSYCAHFIFYEYYHYICVYK